MNITEENYKKLAKMLAFPYTIIIVLMGGYKIWSSNPDWKVPVIVGQLIVLAICNTIALISTLHSCMDMAKGKYSIRECVNINLIAKLLQLPAFIIKDLLAVFWLGWNIFSSNFYQGTEGFAATVILVLIYILTVFMTGLLSLGCTARLKQEELIKGKVTPIMVLLSFIYPVDIIIAIIYKKVSSK